MQREWSISIFLNTILKCRIAVHLLAMDLLQAMLEKEPENRISTKDALKHKAFKSVLSKSPLIYRNLFSTDYLIAQTKLLE